LGEEAKSRCLLADIFLALDQPYTITDQNASKGDIGIGKHLPWAESARMVPDDHTLGRANRFQETARIRL
jgi:hypothetical protein